ncbi:hypothetical protein [Burkholderia cenocepacia]|uniref:hypothetical protein n=1 Tax=Burkholderia cenocepacia TaxID=95486 RepID=UPI00286F299E|nr:hypothetical protein [Burkholderia cenocepacia]
MLDVFQVVTHCLITLLKHRNPIRKPRIKANTPRRSPYQRGQDGNEAGHRANHGFCTYKPRTGAILRVILTIHLTEPINSKSDGLIIGQSFIRKIIEITSAENSANAPQCRRNAST